MLAFRTPQTGASHRMWDWLPATVTRAPHSQSGAKDAACGMVRFEHVSLAYIHFIYIYRNMLDGTSDSAEPRHIVAGGQTGK